MSLVTPSLFSEVRRVPPIAIAAFIVLHLVLKAGIFGTFFLENVADPVYAITRGVVTHSATAGILQTAILLVFLFGSVGVRGVDLGARLQGLGSGIVITLFVWLLAQTGTVLVGSIDGGTLQFGSILTLSGISLSAGLVEAQAGGAVIEEIVYRGFLFPQIFLLLRYGRGWKAPRAGTMALFVSQLYFAICHFPAALRTYAEPWIETTLWLVQVFVVGLLFCIAYLVTGNLFAVIGLHSLLNFPGPLFITRVAPFFLVIVAGCLVLAFWPQLSRTFSSMFSIRGPDIRNYRLNPT
jgi:membrane protease YdiL (CAAX protease family)